VVGDQHAEDGGQFEQLVPVLARAGQATGLATEDQPDVVQPDLGEQPLEPGPVGGRAATLAEVVVDHQDAVGPPAAGDGSVDELRLTVGRFSVLEDLPLRGLADVNHGQALEVTVADFARRRGRGGRRDGRSEVVGAHGRPPVGGAGRRR
jgi:hypothetical protein